MRWWIVVGVCVILAWLWPPAPSPSLKSKRVLLCGASMGIGEHIAYRYAREGAKLVLVARRAAQLQRVADECYRLGAEGVHVVAADLSREEECDETVRSAISYLGQIDTLILNHVTQFFQNWDDTKPSERYTIIEKLFRVNTFSYFHIAMSALPSLNQTNGHIGVVSSVAGKIGTLKLSPYSATKHALHGFFDSLRQDLHDRTNVTITTHVLGVIGSKTEVKDGREKAASLIPRASPADAAESIVIGTEMGRRETYFPFVQAYGLSMLYHLWPSGMDALVRFLVAN